MNDPVDGVGPRAAWVNEERLPRQVPVTDDGGGGVLACVLAHERDRGARYRTDNKDMAALPVGGRVTAGAAGR